MSLTFNERSHFSKFLAMIVCFFNLLLFLNILIVFVAHLKSSHVALVRHGIGMNIFTLDEIFVPLVLLFFSARNFGIIFKK